MTKLSFLLLICCAVIVACSGQSRLAADEIVETTTGIGAVKQKLEADVALAKVQCITLCKNKLNQDANLSDGPCLANPIANQKDWVCDVAHNPRQAVDNNPLNQCSSFRSGQAKHFVEVDENCSFIKSQ